MRRVDPVAAAATDLAGPFTGEIFGLNVKDVTGDGVFAEGFESGDTRFWSATVP